MLWPKNPLCYLRPVGEAGIAAGGPRAPLSGGSGLCIHVEVWFIGMLENSCQEAFSV